MYHSGSLPRLTLARASRLLQSGHVTSEELSLYCHTLAIAGEDKWHLNAFTRISDLESMMKQARASDSRRRAASGNISPLDGIPVSIKANMAISHEPLTAGSRILGSDSRVAPPCGYDADVVATLLRKCGAVLVGVTNMDEFGMGSLGSNVVVSPETGASVTRNPAPYLRLLHMKPPPVEDDDSQLADFIRAAPDNIMKAHAEAFEKEDAPLLSAGGSSCGSGECVTNETIALFFWCQSQYTTPYVALVKKVLFLWRWIPKLHLWHTDHRWHHLEQIPEAPFDCQQRGAVLLV